MDDSMRDITTENEISDLRKTDFFNKTITLQAMIGVNLKNYTEEGFVEKKQMARETLQVLGAQNALQMMLGAQMAAVHDLQQDLMIYANNVKGSGNQSYYVNAVVKLSNTFIQQANLMHKLQGNGQQQLIVGNVHVHSGGQAVVGKIQAYGADEGKK